MEGCFMTRTEALACTYAFGKSEGSPARQLGEGVGHAKQHLGGQRAA